MDTKKRKTQIIIKVLFFVMLTTAFYIPMSYAETTETDIQSGVSQDTLSIDNQTATLTYRDAVAHALSVSDDLTQASIEYQRAEKNYTHFKNSNRNNYSTGIDQQRLDITYQYQWKKKMVDTTKSQIENKVISSMDEISLKQMEINKAESDLQLKKEKLNIEMLKLQCGMTNRIAVQNLQTQYSMDEITLDSMKIELDALYSSFNSMMEYPEGKRDIMEFSLDYVPFKSNPDYDINSSINESKVKDPYLWYLEKNLDSAEFKLLTYDYNVNGNSYSLTKLDLAEANLSVEVAEKAYNDVVKKWYNSGLQLEDSIESVEYNLATLRDSLSVTKLRYDLGLCIKYDVDSIENTINNLNYKMIQLKLSHSELQRMIEKPYLAPQYVS